MSNRTSSALLAVLFVGAATAASAAPRVHHHAAMPQANEVQYSAPDETGYRYPMMKPHETELDRVMIERTEEFNY